MFQKNCELYKVNKTLENIISAFEATSIIEWIGVLAGVFYVVLISYKLILAWFFALISSLVYVYLCYVSNLFLETGLQFFYVIMALYGWYKWNKESSGKDGEITTWTIKTHVINISMSTFLFLSLGFVFDSFTSQANPYTDAFSTVFSLGATYMVTKKILENWIYWMVIDAVCIYLFASRELYLTAVLFFIYTLIALFGYFQWRRKFISQTTL
jgi:nicotinamide mononucleotide transporter